MPVDAWIDSSNRIRRLAMTYSLQVPDTQQTSKVAMVMDFTAYGPQPNAGDSAREPDHQPAVAVARRAWAASAARRSARAGA